MNYTELLKEKKYRQAYQYIEIQIYDTQLPFATREKYVKQFCDTLVNCVIDLSYLIYKINNILKLKYTKSTEDRTRLKELDFYHYKILQICEYHNEIIACLKQKNLRKYTVTRYKQTKISPDLYKFYRLAKEYENIDKNIYMISAVDRILLELTSKINLLTY